MGLWNVRTKIAASTFVLMAAVFGVLVPIAQAATTDLLNGQKQYYTVMMRADKQALVYAKVTFENSSAKDDLKSFSFTLPDDVKVDNLTVQQILAKKTARTCRTYETYDTYKARVSYSYLQSQYYYDQNKQCATYDETSTYDEDFDFDANMSSTTEYYYYDYYLRRSTDSKFEYNDLTPARSGQTYTVELPNAIHPKKQGAVLVAYTSKSYISGSLGRFQYDFRTFTAKELVNKAVVAINFDDEVYSTLASSKRQVSTSAASGVAQGTALTADASYESKTVDDIQTGVGTGGRYVKEKNQLLPGETFSVKGVFATSKFVLYAPTVLRWLLVLALLGSAGWFGYRLYRAKHPRGRGTSSGPALEVPEATTTTKEVAAIGVRPVVFTSLVVVGINGLLALAVIGLLAAVSFTAYETAFVSLMVLLAVMVGAVTLFVLPFLHVLLRHGLRSAYRWLLCHTAILILVTLVICGLYVLLHQSSPTPFLN